MPGVERCLGDSSRLRSAPLLSPLPRETARRGPALPRGCDVFAREQHAVQMYGGPCASSASEPSPPVQLVFSFFQRLTKGAAVIPGSRPTAGEKDPRFATGTV